jgi:hypothetical protein
MWRVVCCYRFLAERIDPPLHEILHLQLCHTSEWENDEARQSHLAAIKEAGMSLAQGCALDVANICCHCECLFVRLLCLIFLSCPITGHDMREAWSPMGICEALAYRNKWRNKRGGRLDIFRAANWILRSALAGQNNICMGFWTPEEMPELDTVIAT